MDKARDKHLTHHQEGWTGYTLEEISYKRAYMAAKRELEKERLKYNLTTIKGTVGSGAVDAVRRVASGIPMVSYGMLAFNVASKGFKIVKSFLPRKKNKKKLKA